MSLSSVIEEAGGLIASITPSAPLAAATLNALNEIAVGQFRVDALASNVVLDNQNLSDGQVVNGVTFTVVSQQSTAVSLTYVIITLMALPLILWLPFDWGMAVAAARQAIKGPPPPSSLTEERLRRALAKIYAPTSSRADGGNDNGIANNGVPNAERRDEKRGFIGLRNMSHRVVLPSYAEEVAKTTDLVPSSSAAQQQRQWQRHRGDGASEVLPEDLYAFRGLLRTKYKTDMKLWAMRRVYTSIMNMREEAMELSARAVMELRDVTGTWVGDLRDQWSDEEWRLVREIRERILRMPVGPCSPLRPPPAAATAAARTGGGTTASAGVESRGARYARARGLAS